MKKLTEFVLDTLMEELHQDLKSILSNENADKTNEFIETIKNLHKNNIDTGVSPRMKKGSSRAIFFPTENKKITLDGKSTALPTVIKLAYTNDNDMFNDSGKLLGQHQNQSESHTLNRMRFGVLKKEGNSYTTNPNGILSPVFETSKNHSWLEMARTKPLSNEQFTNLTKNSKYPEGITHKQLYDVVNTEYKRQVENRESNLSGMSSNEYKHVLNHPLTKKVLNTAIGAKLHPSDLRLENFGEWEHPVTNEKSPVIIDYGYTDKIADLYADSRIKYLSHYGKLVNTK